MFGLYIPPAGQCTVCNWTTDNLSTGEAEGRATDFGEVFPTRYCCRNCLDEHGPTEFIKIRHSEV